MSKEPTDDLERLNTLRDLAQSGPEGQRGESQQAYDELRSRLLEHDWCQGCDDDSITGGLDMESKNTEATRTSEKDEPVDHSWESNRSRENPESLPWPEENETKE